MLEIFIFLQKYVNLECETQYAVITHANTFNGAQISTFLEKKLGDDVTLVQCPFNSEWISWLDTSISNFYALCGWVNRHVAQRVCDSQIELLNVQSHSKITFPPLECLQYIFHRGCMDYKWNRQIPYVEDCGHGFLIMHNTANIPQNF